MEPKFRMVYFTIASEEFGMGIINVMLSHDFTVN